jgi:hypothetical protein
MRNPGRPILAVCALLLAGGFLAGCASGKPQSLPTETPKSTPTPSPVFTSDAQALAAATEVYKKFESALDDIAHDGGEAPERVKPFVTKAGYEFELSEAKKYQTEHSHGTGTTVLNNSVLQSHTEANGVATVTMYVCEDISGVDRIGPDGTSLIAPDRSDYNDYLVELRTNKSKNLIIQSNKYWSGGGICKF